MALGEGEMFGRTSAPVKYMHLNGQLVEMTFAAALIFIAKSCHRSG